ncbi:hypothetical protein EFK50_14060 [Nocardioides marmoriginsengisoli]|uniref:Htaa domain-containing protein n=1 Tax=Nocardioides marmoriginsengisoli TaxID=661483 RepID=A0A3N0CHC7_9ACTN|nr:HtaA domain-containing protein [Nocardioides marmoriginsengisoli]RNL62854.1 hypothetical protein EFK50_14060 [Nocardioides marmoriginsengisoli]
MNRTDDPTQEGSLTWGIKETFRHYVAGLPDGTSEISDGVWLAGAGRYGFPLTAVKGSPVEKLEFGGTLLFSGHGGFLNVLLVDPCLQRSGDEWALSVNAGANLRLEIARGKITALNPGANSLGLEVVLSGHGPTIFGGNYPNGTELDPIVAALPQEFFNDIAAVASRGLPAPFPTSTQERS